MSLKDHNIVYHMVERCCRAEEGMTVMSVDALHLYLLAVEVEHLILYLDMLEAYMLSDDLVTAFYNEGIEGGCFIRPERGCFCEKLKFALSVNSYRTLSHSLACGRKELEGNVGLTGKLYGCFDNALRIACIEYGKRVDISDMDRLSEEEVYLSEDTRESEFILVLEVGAVAPFEYYHLKGIDAFLEVIGYVALGGHMAYLAVAGKSVVDKEIEAGVNAFKIDINLFAVKLFSGDIYASYVEGAGVIIRNVRGVCREGIVFVSIVRCIVISCGIGLP